MSSSSAPPFWLGLLLELLRELRTRSGRRRTRARIGKAVRGRLKKPSPAAAGEGRVRVPGTTPTRAAWQPHDLADRLARRIRRAASGRQARRDGSSSAGETVRERYGPEFYSSIGARGGATVLEERGVEYLQGIGARGGAATRQKYGPEHYAEIGRKGGLAGRGRRRPRKRPGQLELPLEG